MTGALLAVPGPEDAGLVEEGRRLARELASEEDGDAPTVVAVVFEGPADPDEVSAAGADEVVHVVREDGDFAAGAAGVDARAAALADLAADALAVLLPDSPDGVDLGAATAHRLRAACVTGALLHVRDGELLAGRPAYGERAYAVLAFERGPPVVTVDAEALGTPGRDVGGSPSHRTLEVAVEDDERVRHLGTFDVPEDDLARARRIVAGGHGLGGPDGFEVVGDLADALGAAVGASRPPADEGWVPFDRQIGVTGRSIDVDLYVPCAISGDAYHLRSVDAEHLVPINADPDARVWGVADVGIVGDVYEHGPALATAVRRATGDDEPAGGARGVGTVGDGTDDEPAGEGTDGESTDDGPTGEVVE